MKHQNYPKKQKHAEESECGAIIVEATISLTVFMFAMFTLLSIIQIAYIQSRMSVALSCATKEVAEYAHVYYATGIGDKMGAGGGKSSELAGNVAEFLETIGENLGSISNEFGTFFTDSGEAISGDNIADYLEHFIGSGIVWQLMKTNLKADGNDDAESFLRRNHVENPDFSQSKFMEGTSREIFLAATYDVKVIQLLDIDYCFHMRCWAYTTAWD